jgi:hypothetical protein
VTVTYRIGYSTQRMTLAELRAWPRFSGLHPEFQRRLVCLMDHARVAGVDLGIGGGVRTVDEQFRLFDSRHDPVASGGCCSYGGKRWKLVTGAHAAPPGLSYHEPTMPLNGRLWAVAVDVVGWENGWVNQPGRLDRFGLRSFATLTGNVEPWHIQPWTQEIPTSRSSFNPTMHTLKTFTLPAVPAASTAVTVPDPTIRLGSTGTEVRELQSEMRFWGWYTAAIDGSCGPVTVDGIKRLQAAVKVGADGVYGTVTADAYRRWKQALAALA